MRPTIKRRIRIPLALALAALIASSPIRGSVVGSSSEAQAANLDPALRASMSSPAMVSVIVREAMPASDRAERAVRAAGGTVTSELSIIGAFSARVPGTALGRIAFSPTVAAVWSDRKVHVSSIIDDLNRRAANTVWQQSINLGGVRKYGYTGAGVTVALVDTGIRDLPDLAGRIVAKVDFTPDRDGVDYFGHGTHMAGIIAGNGAMSDGTWAGVAPKANLVSVKVAGANGSTDVSVVIAGLQWVYAHRVQYGIRVLNLSFGTDSRQSYLVDPLDYAVEQLWLGGVFVSAAAGNRGPNDQTINKPGDDPFVTTVGGADLKNTQSKTDDTLSKFSSRGPTQDGVAKPEIVAPSVTIVSLRAVGSTIDTEYPSGRVGTDYFKGTGTSQAAAIISGVAALMFQANPGLTPDVAKSTMVRTATRSASNVFGPNTGLVNAWDAAWSAQVGTYAQLPANVGVVPSTGTGSLEASRGSTRVYADLPADGLGANDHDGHADEIKGEIDALGNSWNNLGWNTVVTMNLGWNNLGWSASAWSDGAAPGTGWSDSSWSGIFWDNIGWENTGWDNTGWDNIGWDNVGWESVGWDMPIAFNIGWGRL